MTRRRHRHGVGALFARQGLRSLTAIFGIAIVFIGLAPFSTTAFAESPEQSAETFPPPVWTDTVGSIAISSPTVAEIDGVQAVLFGTESGYLYVINAETGAALPGWPQPVELSPGTTTAIESSPTVAYLNGRNRPPTIIVGAGSTYVANQQGGLVAFRPNGTVRFTFHTFATFNEWKGSPTPDQYSNSVFSTPAVGDLLGNGQQDIVFGSYDHWLYALHPNGTLVRGFPIDTEDTIWSSPALFHVRGPKRAEDIFIGGDASGRDGCYGGFIYDVSDASGTPEIKWQHCENQTIWSSPAVGAINASGRIAVVVGTGFGETPPYPSDTDRVFAYYAKNGRRVPGWPVVTAGPAFGSPAIGSLAGSSTPDVVDTSWCLSCSDPADDGASMVYAWTGSGQLIWSQTLAGANDFSSPVLVDLTGQDENDVLVGSSAGLYPLDGATGSFLFDTSEQTPINTCSVQNSPAIVDIAGNGPDSGWHMFEACGGPIEVAQTGRLYNYPLPDVPVVNPPWPMWRQGPAHDGVSDSS